MALIVLLVPTIREAFRLEAMDRAHWLIVVLLSLAPIAIVELFKLFRINGVKSDME